MLNGSILEILELILNFHVMEMKWFLAHVCDLRSREKKLFTSIGSSLPV